jgi:anti-sigma regulatory factor (Ser/Thr protein kinase)
MSSGPCTRPRSPGASPEALRWRGRARPEAVGVARRLLAVHAARAGADRETRERLQLAVSEAISNVVMHAYAHADRPGDVAVTLERRGERLHVLVRDDGRGLLPRADSPGLGLGLGLMAQTADAFDIRTRPAGGVDVRLEFALRHA